MADEVLDPRYCNATKRDGSGERCKQPAGHGVKGVHSGCCSKHGGATRTHRAAAEMELARRAVETYGLPVDVDPAVALMRAVATSYGSVLYLEAKVAALGIPWSEEDAKPHVAWSMLQVERKHHGDVCRDALRAGVERRAVELAEDMARQIVHGFAEFARRLGHDPESPDVREAGREALQLVAGERG